MLCSECDNLTHKEGGICVAPSVALSVRPLAKTAHVRPHGKTRLPLNEFFVKFWYLSIFQNSVAKIEVSLETDKSNRHLT